MLLIPQITDQPLQSSIQILPDGTELALTIYYIPMQYGWFITNLTWNSFILKGLRITTNPNMLQQWRNIIPFGLGCYTVDGQEPTQQQDFLSGYGKLYILTSEEVAEYTELLANG